MPAVSVAQKQFFNMVDAAQKGKIPMSKLDGKAKDAAKDTKKDDVKDFVNTPNKGLPDRVSSKKESVEMSPMTTPQQSPTPPQTTPETPSLEEVMGRFNEYGHTLRSNKSMRELAEELLNMADMAEGALVNELASDWFDAHTIKRNIKEVRKYVEEFTKTAAECDRLTQRNLALYEDIGRVFGRYFEIKTTHTTAQPSVEQARENFQKIEDNMVEVAKSKLSKEQQLVFEGLDHSTKLKAAVKIIAR